MVPQAESGAIPGTGMKTDGGDKESTTTMSLGIGGNTGKNRRSRGRPQQQGKHDWNVD